ncbi:MAG: hypothetical protein J5621_02645, partial [Paludibacteraceae bacterium]|nr:hypothetical protein [Paludibacteraceae bacterium]
MPIPLYEPCPDGILLFREDFGGNNINDPEVGTTSIDGMAYQQIYSTKSGMDKGHYLVSKHGYENGTGWFRIDDHTYPNDPDKGYFMEVDGAGSGS